MNATNPDDILAYLKTIPQGITFIHGKAGSGKTTLIRRLDSEISGCQILVPTNFAASLYSGARTIHSFFYASLDDLDEGFQNPQELTEERAQRTLLGLRGIRMLIIDEISMVRSDLFEMINQICQKAMRNNKPFGGIPIVLVGDLFQLPPIVSDDAVLQYLKNEYGGIYFFNSHIVQKEMPNIKLFELTKSYRQSSDPEFVKILDAFRFSMSPERRLEIMNGINSRVTDLLPDDAIYVASSNEEVSRVNTDKLAALPGETTTIEAEYTIQKKDGSGYVVLKHSDLPSDEDIREIIVPSAYDSLLRFKPGARVVLCKNSKYFGYINGDFGTIEGFNGEFFTIRLDKDKDKDKEKTVYCPHPNDRYRNKQVTEYRYDMEYDSSTHKLVRKSPYVQKTKQFPVKLAYAFTIHKAQGQTYNKVIIDLNSHIFAPGQLYVALSRAKSLQGLYLTRPVAYSDIISDKSVLTFLSALRQFNGMPAEESERPRAFSPAPSETSDQFANVIRDKEKSPSAKECLLCALKSYNELIVMEEHEKASWELRKIVDIILSTYQTDEDERLRDAICRQDLTSALRGILDIYTQVVKGPQKQYQPDNRTIATKLI